MSADLEAQKRQIAPVVSPRETKISISGLPTNRDSAFKKHMGPELPWLCTLERPWHSRAWPNLFEAHLRQQFAKPRIGVQPRTHGPVFGEEKAVRITSL